MAKKVVVNRPPLPLSNQSQQLLNALIANPFDSMYRAVLSDSLIEHCEELIDLEISPEIEVIRIQGVPWEIRCRMSEWVSSDIVCEFCRGKKRILSDDASDFISPNGNSEEASETTAAWEDTIKCPNCNGKGAGPFALHVCRAWPIGSVFLWDRWPRNNGGSIKQIHSFCKASQRHNGIMANESLSDELFGMMAKMYQEYYIQTSPTSQTIETNNREAIREALNRSSLNLGRVRAGLAMVSST